MNRTPASRPSHQDERGQSLAGYVIAVFITVSMATFLMRSMTSSKADTEKRVYRELALNVARAGFEDGISFFRRQPGGVYLDAYPSDSPSSGGWVTPWPQWPDAAFLPQGEDTDHYSLLALTATGSLGPTARAIMRTFPVNAFSTTATAQDAKTSNLWGRYVLRRQNTRNWSPGPNTFAAFNDPEAVHDITHIRGISGTKPGSGNYWSVFSRAYLFDYPSDLTIAAAHEGNSLLSAPRRYYNNQRLLLATASVYGEVYRINFNLPAAAAFAGGATTVNTKGNLSGQGAGTVANATGTQATGSGSINGSPVNTNVPPSVGYCFPGLNETRLKDIATKLDATKVGLVSVFPRSTDANFSDVTSRTSFYFISSSATLLANDTRVMSGVGLVYIKGNLTIENRNLSDWNGVVFVQGNASLRDRASISGILIATGTITIGNSADLNIGSVNYNPDTIATTQTYLQDFQVLSSSIITSAN